jgi:hypothetical protein
MLFICMNCRREFDSKGWKGGCPFGCGGGLLFPKHQLGEYEGETFQEWMERRDYEDDLRRTTG